MPHAGLKITGGANQNRTPTLNEASLSDCQLIRYMPDPSGITLVQKYGGWLKYFPNVIGSIARALWGWNDIDDISHLAVGAEESLDVITNGVLIDVTPRTLSYDAPVMFETTAGSSQVKITDGGNFVFSVTGASGTGTTATVTFSGTHIFEVGSVVAISSIMPTGYNGNYSVTASSAGSVSYASSTSGAYVSGGSIENASFITGFDVVDIQTQIAVGGLVLFGLYQATADTTNTYFIDAADVLGAPQAATFTTSTITVTGASGTGTTATLTFTSISADDVPEVGSVVSVQNVNPAAYNGTQIVTAATQTTLEYDSTATAGYTSGGTIEDYGSVPLFETSSGSTLVNVYLHNHGYTVGNTFPLLVALALNGTILFGSYIVYDVISDSEFVIRASNSATDATVTGAAGTGATATLTYVGNFTFPVGDSILVSGMTPSGYNTSSAVVTASTAQTVSYANATTGFTSGGTIRLLTALVPLNEGLVRFKYYIGVSQNPSGAGFGVGPFGGGGFGVGVTPTTPSGQPIEAADWSLDNWGSILIASPEDGAIYTWDPISNQNNATVIPEAPAVNSIVFVAMPQRQVIAAGTTFNGILDHLLIRWCDVENYFQWIALPTNQAGSYRLTRGSRIVSALQAAQQGLIWTDIGLWSMQYIGQPLVYSFNEIGVGCGLIGRKAAGVLNGAVYWMGQSQFYRLAGSGVETIQCDIWDVIFQDLDTANVDKIRIAPNSRFNEIAWFYPSLGGGGEVDKYVKFNTLIGIWDFGTLGRTAWINQSVLGAPIGAAPDEYIYQHERGFNADTAPMVASFTTGYFVLSEAEFKVFIDQFWPDMKWGLYGGTQSANVQLTFYVTDYPGDTPVANGPYTLTQAVKYITPRFRGRLVSLKFESSDIDSFWRIGLNRYRYQADGKF